MNTKENLEHINSAVSEISTFINNNYLPLVDDSDSSVFGIRRCLNIITANSEAMQSAITAINAEESTDEKLAFRVKELENDLAIKCSQFDNLNNAYNQAMTNIKVLENKSPNSVGDETQILNLDLEEDTKSDEIELDFVSSKDDNVSKESSEVTSELDKDYTLELIDKLKYELRDTKLKLLESNRDNGTLTDDNIKLKGLISDYKIQLSALKSNTDLELLANKILGLVEITNDKLNSTNNNILSLGNNLDRTNKFSEDSLNVLKSQNKNVSDLCVELKTVKGNTEELSKQVTSTKDSLDNLSDKVVDASTSISSVKEDLESNKKLTEDLASDLIETKQDINKKLSFLEKLKRLVSND